MTEMQPGYGQHSPSAKRRRVGDPLPTISLSVGSGRTTGTVSIPGLDPNNPPPLLFGDPGEGDPQSPLIYDTTAQTWAASFASTDAVYTLRALVGTNPTVHTMVTVTIPAANGSTLATLQARPVLSVVVDDDASNGSLSCSVRESATFQPPESTGQNTTAQPAAAPLFGKATLAAILTSAQIDLLTADSTGAWSKVSDVSLASQPTAVAMAEIGGFAFLAVAMASSDEIVVYRTDKGDADLGFDTQVGSFPVTNLEDGIGLASNGQGLTLTVNSNGDILTAQTQVTSTGGTSWSTLSNPFPSSTLTFANSPALAALGRTFVMALTDSTGIVYSSTQANPTAAWTTPAAVSGFTNATTPVTLTRWFGKLHLAAYDSSDSSIGLTTGTKDAAGDITWSAREALPDTSGTWSSNGLVAVSGGPVIQPVQTS